MEELKNLFDIIFLSDEELGFDTGHDGDRPCIIVGIDNETGEGYVVPLSSQGKYGSHYHQLVFGSWIDLTNKPIRITASQLRWSNISDKYIDGEDVEILEERFHKWMNMGEEYDF